MVSAKKFHKVITNPTPENTTVISKRTMNQNLALTLAKTGRIFVSNMGKVEAWRSSQSFSKSLGMPVKQFAAQYTDERGVRYDGYEFVVVQDVPLEGFAAICPHCAESLVLKCGICGKVVVRNENNTSNEGKITKQVV